MLGIALLLAASVELAVKALFRWRTWRDRGIAAALATACAAVLLFTGPADRAYELLAGLPAGPVGGVLLPAVAFLTGLLGLNPFLVALFVGAAHPDHRLSLSLSLPMVAGNVPLTIYLAFTMPPGREKLDR